MMSTVEPSFLARHSETIVSNGYSILPVKPRDKAPGRWDVVRSTWTDAPGWNRLCDRLPTEGELEMWANWPDASIGIACGNVVAIDIDILDHAMAVKVEEMTRATFGDTPLVRIGMRPKRLMVYRCDEPFQSFDLKPVQVLARGRQFVAFGIHPVTQLPYEWVVESPVSVDRSDLPLVTERDVRSWAMSAAKLIGVVARPAGDSRPSSAEHEPATFAAVEQALQFVPSDSLTSRADWIAIGMAIKSGLGEAGNTLWHQWSARDDRYTSKECETQWASFRNDRAGGVGVGTLYDRARLYGWHPDGVFLYQHEEDAAAAAITINIPELIANIIRRTGGAYPAEEALETPPANEVQWTVPVGEPGWLRDLGGGLRAFVDYTREQSHRDQPELALAAALPVFGTLAGRRYQSETGLLTNIYTVGIAGSASGKEVAIGVGTRLFEAAGQINMVGGEEFASGRAIVSALYANPASFFALDEFGKLLSRATNPRSHSSNDADVMKTMLTMFSASQRIYSGVVYANRKEAPRTTITRPCLSIYGPTTGSTFWKALTSGEAADGSLARMLVFQADNSYPDQRRISHQAIPEYLSDIAKRVAAGAEGHNTFPLGEGPETMPNPFTVRLGPGVTKQDDDLMVEMTRLLRENEGSAAEPIYGRIREVVLKVAMIRAIANRPESPIIAIPDFDWAACLVVERAKHMIRAIEMNVSDNEQEAMAKRVLRIVNDAGAGGITQSALTRKTQFLDTRKRNDIMAGLVEGGMVTAIKSGIDPRRLTITYHAA